MQKVRLGLDSDICQQLSKLLGGSIRLDWTEVDEGCRLLSAFHEKEAHRLG